jgi:YD repeat-containing protein
MRNHAKFLNEVSERRRLNSLFFNEQSAAYGAPIGYVNSSRGNLTFLRRDIVAPGRIPLILARVYDSSFELGRDYGPGWHLTLAERITRNPDGTLTYIDDSASVIRLVATTAESYRQDEAAPSNLDRIEKVRDTFRVIDRRGWIKSFELIGEDFLMTTISDPHGNTLTLRYSQNQLMRIEAENGRFVAIERDSQSRVSRVTDDQQRAVSYSYDDDGNLRVVKDLGGNQWNYEYDRSDRLRVITDPRKISILDVVYDASARVRALTVLGASSRYKFKTTETTVENASGQITIIGHDPRGLTTSVTNPDGFVSTVVFDPPSRISALLHNGSPRAVFSYDDEGHLKTLTRFDAQGQVELRYDYDLSGRPLVVSDGSGALLTLAYNVAGDLVDRAGSGQVVHYEYTPRGELRSLSEDGQDTVYTYNDDGAIERIDGPNGTIRLGYFYDGKVESIRFADGTSHRYHYNALGFRSKVERSDGSEMTFDYDVAGNLVSAHGMTADGSEAGQDNQIDEANRLEAIHYADGGDVTYTYDANGNPATLTPTGNEDGLLRYTYDTTNRLVQIDDSGNIAAKYTYGPTEPDLRLQMDDRTARVDSGLVRQPNSLDDLLGAAYTRPYGSYFGIVRFDQATQIVDLPSDFGISLPDAISVNSLLRRKLKGIDDASLEARVNFDRASNVMFLPPEYATINCVNPCIFTGINLTGNGVSGAVSVAAGSPVLLVASKASGSTCNTVVYDWQLNGIDMPWLSTGVQTYTFATAGSNQVKVIGECSGCDLIRTATLTVNVLPTCSPFCQHA